MANDQEPPDEIAGDPVVVRNSDVKGGGYPGNGNIGELDDPDPMTMFPAPHDPLFADPKDQTVSPATLTTICGFVPARRRSTPVTEPRSPQP